MPAAQLAPCLAVLMAIGVLTASAERACADDARALAFGKHLAQQCTSCHRIDGSNNGIPSIVGWERAQFVAVLGSYKDNVRTNEVMVSLAQTLGAAEMEALAAYFGSLKASPAKAVPKKK